VNRNDPQTFAEVKIGDVFNYQGNVTFSMETNITVKLFKSSFYYSQIMIRSLTFAGNIRQLAPAPGHPAGDGWQVLLLADECRKIKG